MVTVGCGVDLGSWWMLLLFAIQSLRSLGLTKVMRRAPRPGNCTLGRFSDEIQKSTVLRLTPHIRATSATRSNTRSVWLLLS